CVSTSSIAARRFFRAAAQSWRNRLDCSSCSSSADSLSGALPACGGGGGGGAGGCCPVGGGGAGGAVSACGADCGGGGATGGVPPLVSSLSTLATSRSESCAPAASFAFTCDWNAATGLIKSA